MHGFLLTLVELESGKGCVKACAESACSMTATDAGHNMLGFWDPVRRASLRASVCSMKSWRLVSLFRAPLSSQHHRKSEVVRASGEGKGGGALRRRMPAKQQKG